MEYNNTNIEKIAWRIVEDMSIKDLEQFVYEEMIHVLGQDEEVFDNHVEIYKED